MNLQQKLHHYDFIIENSRGPPKLFLILTHDSFQKYIAFQIPIEITRKSFVKQTTLKKKQALQNLTM